MNLILIAVISLGAIEMCIRDRIYPFIKPFETMLLKRADLIAPTSPNYRDSSKPLFLSLIHI